MGDEGETDGSYRPAFTPIEDTLFLTLCGRALDNGLPHPILGDTMALKIVHELDYDAAKFHLSASPIINIAHRAKLFFLSPVVRPWHDESTIGGAVASMSSDAWVAAHLFAVFPLILMPLGLLGLCSLVAGSRGYGLMHTSAVVIWLGAGLALPYYGAEDFALHAIARQMRSGTSLDMLTLVDAIRFGAAAAVTFAAGLLLQGVGWRTDRHIRLAYCGAAAA